MVTNFGKAKSCDLAQFIMILVCLPFCSGKSNACHQVVHISGSLPRGAWWLQFILINPISGWSSWTLNEAGGLPYEPTSLCGCAAVCCTKYLTPVWHCNCVLCILCLCGLLLSVPVWPVLPNVVLELYLCGTWWHWMSLVNATRLCVGLPVAE